MRELLIPKTPEAFRFNNFNTLRLAMALLVVWSHSFAIFLGTEDNEPISLLMNGTYNAGNVGVLVFFVISGFLISHSFERSKSIVDYMLRRVRRIHPGFIVATAICAFIVIPIYSDTAKIDTVEVGKVIALNALLQNYMPPHNAFASNPIPDAVNGSLWSISFEFWCYIFVAVLGVIRIAHLRWWILALTVVVGLSRVAADAFNIKPGLGIVGDIFGWPYLWTKVLPSFLLGSLAYRFRASLPRRATWLLGLAAASIIAAHVYPAVAHLIFPVAMAYSVFYAAFSPVRLPDAARWGDFSYGTYLYAFPIQQMLQASLGATLPFPMLIAMSFALSLAAGVMSWHLVEKHFLSHGPKHQPSDATDPVPSEFRPS